MKTKNARRKVNHSDNRRQVIIKDQLKVVDTGIHNGVFVFSAPLTLGELAVQIKKTSSDLIKYFFLKGKIITINELLTIEQIGEICLENNLDFKIEKEISAENVLDNIDFKDEAKDLKARPPIVTIMGHVDHGKTTLLDKLRLSAVAADEAGAITQHIGAYQVAHNGALITFIDTPGHEAFSEMRARGANITDIVVLVVAADDGVKQQTKEALTHAKLANVVLIVFINKMDKPTANSEKIMQQLSDLDVTPEVWGGDTIFIEGSAHSGLGLDKLLNAILTLSEVHDWKANPNRLAYGTVVETNLDKGFGPISTVIVQNGTIRKGDYVVAGSTYGRIRLLLDEKQLELESAAPSKPVVLIGLESLPTPGEKFLCIKDEKEAKLIANQVHQKKQRAEQFKQLNSVDIRSKIASGELKNINVLLRTDVSGSLEAIKAIIEKIEVDGATIMVVKANTGGITESDIRLAQTFNAVVVAFNIRPPRYISDLASSLDVNILSFDVIYKLKEELESILKGILDPIYEEKVLGECEVLKIWKHSDVGTILGVKVASGKISRKDKCRIIRDGVVIYTSEISTLKHQKDDVKEICEGRECGLTIKNFNDVHEKDVIEVFTEVKKTYDEAHHA